MKIKYLLKLLTGVSFIFSLSLFCATLDEKQQKEEQKIDEKKNEYDSNRDKDKKKNDDGGQKTEDEKKAEDGGLKTEGGDKKPEDKKKEDDKQKPDERKKPEDKKIILKKKIGGEVKEVEKKKKHKRDGVEDGDDYEEYEIAIGESQVFEYSQNSNMNFFNFDLKYWFSFNAKYSLMGTYLSSSLESNYFTGNWSGDMLFSGRGGELTFGVTGLMAKNIGVLFSLGYYYHSGVTNSFSDSQYTTVETSELMMLDLKMEAIHYPIDWFFVKGGLGIAVYTVNTSLETNMPGYIYTGLEGSTSDYEVTLGAGIDYEVFTGLRLKLGLDGALFIYDRTKSKGLRDGLTAYAGLGFVW